jgi:hypothetical protein
LHFSPDTHVISAIIQVGQKFDRPWPLNIIDYDQKKHDVVLRPGDLVWYESARYKSSKVQKFIEKNSNF